MQNKLLGKSVLPFGHQSRDRRARTVLNMQKKSVEGHGDIQNYKHQNIQQYSIMERKRWEQQWRAIFSGLCYTAKCNNWRVLHGIAWDCIRTEQILCISISKYVKKPYMEESLFKRKQGSTWQQDLKTWNANQCPIKE